MRSRRFNRYCDSSYWTTRDAYNCLPKLTEMARYDDQVRGFVRIDDVVGNRKGENPVLHWSCVIEPIRKLNLVRYGFGGAEACPNRMYAVDEYRNVWYIGPEALYSYLDFDRCPVPNPSRSDIWNKVTNPYGNNFFETVVSFKEGIVSLTSSVGSKLRALSALPKPPIIPRKRSDWQKLRSAGTAALSSYLEWEFGWKQAGEDVARLLAFTGDLRDHLRKLKDNEGKTIRKGFSQQVSSGGTRVVGDSQITWSAESVGRIAYKLKYAIRTDTLAAHVPVLDEATFNLAKTLDYFGLSVSAKRTWNIVPGSWLIDQILPISDVLNDLGNSDALAGSVNTVEYLGSIESVKTTITGTVTTKESGWLYAGNKSYTAPFKASEYVRSVSFDPPPQFSIRNRPSGGGITRTGEAYLALLALNKLK